eukprot:g12920.t1
MGEFGVPSFQYPSDHFSLCAKLLISKRRQEEERTDSRPDQQEQPTKRRKTEDLKSNRRAQHSTAQHSTAQHSIAQHSIGAIFHAAKITQIAQRPYSLRSTLRYTSSFSCMLLMSAANAFLQSEGKPQCVANGTDAKIWAYMLEHCQVEYVEKMRPLEDLFVSP